MQDYGHGWHDTDGVIDAYIDADIDALAVVDNP